LGDQPAESDPSPSPTCRGDINPFTYIHEPHPNISIFLSLNSPCFYPPSLRQTFSVLAYLSNLSITVPIKILYNEGKMLHCEQPAVGYPTFPGNIEALSIPASLLERQFLYKYSPPSSLSLLLPTAITTSISPPESTTTLQTSPGPKQSSKLKRRQTLAACSSCRKRKSKVCASLQPENKSNSMTGACSHPDLTHDLSVTVPALDVTPASTKPHPASTRSKKAKHSNKPLEKNSKPTKRLCSCYEEHRL
jgi:hypothetical protein